MSIFIFFDEGFEVNVEKYWALKSTRLPSFSWLVRRKGCFGWRSCYWSCNKFRRCQAPGFKIVILDLWQTFGFYLILILLRHLCLSNDECGGINLVLNPYDIHNRTFSLVTGNQFIDEWAPILNASHFDELFLDLDQNHTKFQYGWLKPEDVCHHDMECPVSGAIC